MCMWWIEASAKREAKTQVRDKAERRRIVLNWWIPFYRWKERCSSDNSKANGKCYCRTTLE